MVTFFFFLFCLHHLTLILCCFQSYPFLKVQLKSYLLVKSSLCISSQADWVLLWPLRLWRMLELAALSSLSPLVLSAGHVIYTLTPVSSTRLGAISWFSMPGILPGTWCLAQGCSEKRLRPRSGGSPGPGLQDFSGLYCSLYRSCIQSWVDFSLVWFFNNSEA